MAEEDSKPTSSPADKHDEHFSKVSSSSEKKRDVYESGDIQNQSIVKPAVREKGIDEEQRKLYERFASIEDEAYHSKMRGKLLLKVDWHLLPLLILMYLMNFLDRK